MTDRSRPAIRRHLLPILPIALLLAGGTIWRLAHPKGALILWLGAHRSPELTALFTLTDRLGEEWAYIMGIVLLLLTARLRMAAFLPVLGASVAALSAAGKALFHQPRPKIWFPNHDLILPALPDHYVVTGFNSFPSGHTFSAFAVFTYLALTSRSPAVRLSCVLLATLGGLSRVYLCQHFLEDVLCGAALGTTLAFALHAAQSRLSDTPHHWWNRRLIS